MREGNIAYERTFQFIQDKNLIPTRHLVCLWSIIANDLQRQMNF